MTKNQKAIETIITIRTKKNISQVQLAKLLNISKSAYSRLEHGDTELTVNMLDEICIQLNTTLAEVLDLLPQQVNNFDRNMIAQNNSTLNISLTPEEFQKIYKKIQDGE